jgi:uncharacterized protein (TIGR02646 family)
VIKLTRPACPRADLLKTDYSAPVNKQALRQASCSKCMYCEGLVDDIYPGDVEHIKPKKVFPELMYEWSNLGYACWKCNNKKRDKYDATCEIVNPYDEDPNQYLEVGMLNITLEPTQSNQKAGRTIVDVDLNRRSLCEKRASRIKEIGNICDMVDAISDPVKKNSFIEILLKEADADRSYSLFVKHYLLSRGYDLV